MSIKSYSDSLPTNKLVIKFINIYLIKFNLKIKLTVPKLYDRYLYVNA